MFSATQRRGVPYFTFGELERIPGLLHAFTSRQTDAVDIDAQPVREVAMEKSALLKALALRPEDVTLLRQVHSSRVLKIGSDRQIPSRKPQGDGVLVREAGVFAAIRTADCVPVLAVAPKRRAFCLLHAGWRGTARSITARGVEALLKETGAAPEELVLALGPCIRACCYEVGEEVRAAFEAAGQGSNRIFSADHLDLVEANRLQAKSLGVSRVLDSGMCTSCRPDLFYSYRREGQTGRLWALAGFVLPDPEPVP